MPAHPVLLHPTAGLAPRALLPGDPGRALALAQVLLESPLMFNHNRGLWGYTGTASDGEPLTIQATGMGGPSVALVLAELAALGLRTAVRISTATGLDGGPAVGSLLAVREAIALDGTSRALGAGARVGGDPGLTDALAAAAGTEGVVVSLDLHDGGLPDAASGAVARDLGSAAFLAAARHHGLRAGCVLAMAAAGDERLEGDALADAGLALGHAAAAALGLAAPAPAGGAG